MEYLVPENMTVLDALRLIYPESSRRTLQSWLKNGRFFIDGKKLERENFPLTSGQKLHSKTTFKPPKIPGLKILYEDRYFVVIDKPVGLLSVPLDEGETQRNCLRLLKDFYETDKIYAVHRIDRGTSGILVFARGKQSEEKFDTLFEEHNIDREYYAIIEGRLESERGTWESKLLELPSLQVIPSEEGRIAITHFEVIRRSKKYTYLKLNLETGRKHQIRVHCQMASHPIIGDKRYGSSENPLKRLCLHACSLGFKHPFTGKMVRFHSPLPRSFEVLGGKPVTNSK